MGIPVGAHGRSSYNPQGGSRSTSNQQAFRRAKSDAQTNTRNRYINQLFLNELQGMGGPQYGPGGGGSGGGGGYGGGGGGGYGGGPSAFDKWQIAQEEKRRRELELRKAALRQQLGRARNQARPLLGRYGKDYNTQISNIFTQNRGLNSGYDKQLRTIQNEMNSGARGQQAMLQTDLMGQDAGAGDIAALRAAAGAQMQGTDFLSLLGQQYNQRLAQVMANRQGDAKSMGATIKASSLGNLENSYMQALAEIGMMGLL